MSYAPPGPRAGRAIRCFYHKTYEYVHEDNEGHGFRAENARINFYRHMEAFLGKYLAPPADAVAAR